ncbi:MAG TPA: Wzz/FepE/Etk N-terminal domain-containing protein [Burkholderiaceae bacterium]
MTDPHLGAAPAADPAAAAPAPAAPRRADIVDLLLPLTSRWRSLLVVPVVAALLAAGATFLVKPTYSSSVTFLPPQQQNTAASALSSLGALAGISTGSGKSSADQMVSLMTSIDATDRLIDKYHLLEVYDKRWREQARIELGKHSDFRIGKKDGLITVSVEDTDRARAAAMANDYVAELRRMTSALAVSEAQQRRMFFEAQLKQTKDRLVAAQLALGQSGFDIGALKSEPKAAAETYANLRAQLTTAQVKLQMLRSSRSETNVEVLQQKAVVDELQQKTDALEASTKPDASNQPDYVGKYREFRYQETLFDQMARQYELARIDEAKEGALIQVVDPARPAERKSGPRRLRIAIEAGVAALLLFALGLVVRDRWRMAAGDPHVAQRLRVLRDSLRRH